MRVNMMNMSALVVLHVLILFLIFETSVCTVAREADCPTMVMSGQAESAYSSAYESVLWFP